MQNQELWPEPHRRNASCSRPRSSSIYKDPPRTRQRTLILAAFLPWGGSDDTVTRRTGPQHTRFHPARAAAAKRSTSPQACAPTTCHGAGAQYQGGAWPRCSWAAAGPGRASPSTTSAAGAQYQGRAWPRCRWAPAGPRGLAGLRADAPSKARGADGSRAGRRPSAHTAARPIKSGHTAPGTPAAPHATKTPEPEAVPGSGGGGWGIRTPEGLHPTRFPSVRHRPLGESSVHIVPDNHKRKMSPRANPGQWSRSQAEISRKTATKRAQTGEPSPLNLRQPKQ